MTDDTLWSAQDLRAYLRLPPAPKANSTFYKVKKAFPRVPGIALERYDPATVKAIVAGTATPAQKHRAVRRLRLERRMAP